VTKVCLRSFVVSCFALALSAGAVTAQSLPTGWSTKDVGAVGTPGSATSVNNIFTVGGSGANVWGTADEFRFVYRQLTGNGSIVTQVTGVDNVTEWTKAGVMMRESLDANSKHAFMLISPGHGAAYQRRVLTGDRSWHISGKYATAPKYLKLTRTGDMFAAYKSPDGVTWKLVGSRSISMAATIYVGLAVSSHADGVVANAQFEHTEVTGAAEPPPPSPPAPGDRTASTLRILHWNTHHGRGTDGKYDLDRIATWIARTDADVIGLNEVERFVGAHGNEDQPARYAAMLSAKTGHTWYTHYMPTT
jgi:hypothetical protein